MSHLFLDGRALLLEAPESLAQQRDVLRDEGEGLAALLERRQEETHLPRAGPRGAVTGRCSG